jgi:DNA-binding GntR family transcriptional regulator
MAVQFKVSQSPIRDALRKLCEESLVKNSLSGGYYVVKPSLKDIDDIYELRELLELHAIDKAIQNIEVGTLEKLKHKITTQNYDYLAFDRQLHLDIIIKSTKNEKLEDCYSQIFNFVKMCHHICQSRSERKKEASREHLGLIDALMTRESSTSKKLLREHIRNSKKAVVQVLQSFDGSGKLEPLTKGTSVLPGTTTT